MTDSSTLFLHVDQGRPLPVQIRRETAVRSPHTGRELHELHGWIVTSDAQLHQRLATTLPTLGEHPVRSDDEAGEFTGRWCVSWNSYGEAAGVHTYSLILREAEELSLRALLLDEFEFHPYEYREEPLSGGLRIQAKLAGSEEEVLRLRRLARDRKTWVVVRQGIQEEPRDMRLRVEEWSELEDRVKFRITLADAALTSNRDEIDLDGGNEGGRSALEFYANYLESLAETLVSKGVMTREELRVLQESARADSGVIRHELWRVADVDQA